MGAAPGLVGCIGGAKCNALRGWRGREAGQAHSDGVNFKKKGIKAGNKKRETLFCGL